MKFDRDDMEFSHPYFQRDHPSLLEHIKRKISTAKTTANVDEKSNVKHEIVSKVLCDIKMMKGRQESLDTRFVSMKQENEALWREVALLRQKHMKQQQIVNKLIQFLVTIVQPQRGSGIGTMSGVKRRYQLMINDVPEKRKATNPSATSLLNQGPVIRELTEELLDTYDDDDINSPYVVSPDGLHSPAIHDYEEMENTDGTESGIMRMSNIHNIVQYLTARPKFFNGVDEMESTDQPSMTNDEAVTYNTADYGSDSIYDTKRAKPTINLISTTAGTSVASDSIPDDIRVEEMLGEVVAHAPNLRATFARKSKEPSTIQPQQINKPKNTQRMFCLILFNRFISAWYLMVFFKNI